MSSTELGIVLPVKCLKGLPHSNVCEIVSPCIRIRDPPHPPPDPSLRLSCIDSSNNANRVCLILADDYQNSNFFLYSPNLEEMITGNTSPKASLLCAHETRQVSPTCFSKGLR